MKTTVNEAIESSNISELNKEILIKVSNSMILNDSPHSKFPFKVIAEMQKSTGDEIEINEFCQQLLDDAQAITIREISDSGRFGFIKVFSKGVVIPEEEYILFSINVSLLKNPVPNSTITLRA